MLRLVSALALCLVACSAAYYFAYYLPRAHDVELAGQRRKADVELSQRCRNDGLKFFVDFSDEVNDPSMHYMWDDPEFHYSTKLNTCLVFIRYLQFYDNVTSFHHNQVIDVYSNHAILFGDFKRIVGDNPTEQLLNTFKSDVPNYTSKQFLAEKTKLFSE